MRGAAIRAAASVGVYNAFRGLAVGGYMALFPMYMASLGYDMSEIGMVIAVSGLAMASLLPAVGVAIDRYGPRLAVAATGALQVAGILLAAYRSDLPALLASYSLFLLSFLAGQPARMSFLARAVPEGYMGRAVGATSTVFSASRLVGPLAGGLLAEAYGFPLAFKALAYSSAAGLALFLAASAGIRLKPVEPTHSVAEAYKAVLRPRGSLSSLLGYVALDRLGWSLWFPMLTAHLYANGFSESAAGAVVTAGGVVQTLLLPLAGVAVDKLGAARVLAVSEALGVAAALAFADPTPQARAYAAALLMGASIALWVPGYNTLLAKAGGGGGEVYALANTVRSVAGAPSPYLGGLAYDALAPWTPFAASAALLAVAGLYAWRRLPEAEMAGERAERRLEALEAVRR
jgi:DHA1 family multidrug resistance protein-like MFS transporter